MEILNEYTTLCEGNDCIIHHGVALSRFGGVYIVTEIERAAGGWVDGDIRVMFSKQYNDFVDAEKTYKKIFERISQ